MENKNVTKCKACDADIAKGVNKCPHCGKDQRNWFMRHKVLSIIIILVILGGIGSALSGNDKKDTAVKTSTNDTAKTKQETTQNKTETFKVGDVVQLKDYKITVNKVYTVEGNDFAKPKDGNEFLAIDCTVENISKEEQNLSSLVMFKVVDKDGRACEYSLTGQTAANAGQLDGTIGVGRKITGVYVVEVPQGQTGLELEFDSSFLTGGQVIVTLN
ncbi:DUF4352 domain-containing protein [Clostridium kluyveri]|uniref:DUF4352 domain-containing protein n=1 Tax=Clostridium kluyveri TaxID=1534 RepID=UPI002247E522|nr:DUF4352 domain-containing protein [Clostridium kluyveri]UZQ50619.1 DUF4352 domain-containing protein [Clostridium kluyveri]